MTDAVYLPAKGPCCGNCKLTVRAGDAKCPHCGMKFRKPAEEPPDEPSAGKISENEASDHPEIDMATLDKTKISAVLGEPGGYGLMKLGRAGNPVLRIRLLRAAKKKGIDPLLLKGLFRR